MHKTILMPASGAGGTLARWLKQVGDQIRVGDLLAEIESDKAMTTLESPYQGTLIEIRVAEGTTEVPEDQTLAIIAE